MKHLKNKHILLVKDGGLDLVKIQMKPLEVHLDGVLLQKLEG